MGTVNFGLIKRFPQHHSKLPISFKAQIFPHNSTIYGVYSKRGKAFSFTLCCALKTARGKKGGRKKTAVPGSGGRAEEEKLVKGSAPVRPPPSVRRSNDGGVRLFEAFPGLSNLQLALAEMLAVAGLMALGEAPAFDIQKFTDHLFSSPNFLGTFALLGASFMACSYKTEVPLLKVARRWLLLKSRESNGKQEDAETVAKTSEQDLGGGYEALASRVGAIAVHVALLFMMFGGSTESLTVPQGVDSTPPLHFNRLYMDDKKHLEDSAAPNVKETQDADSPNFKGISVVALDGESIILFHKEGKVVGIRQLDDSQLPIEIDGTKIVVVDGNGSTALVLKTDAGLPIVFAGFGALVLKTCLSFLSHGEIWTLQDGTIVVIRGKSKFPDALRRLHDEVESSSSSST